MKMFKKILKELRAAKWCPQSEVAAYLGVSQQTIAKYENGQATPDPTALSKLATFYNVSADYLLGRNKKRPDY